MRALPPPQGLYDGRHEHDACGVAFVAALSGEPTRDVVDKALTALRNLDHRGASGAQVDSGDGAGILLQVPDAFLRAVCDIELPPHGAYAVGTAFLPSDPEEAGKSRAAVEQLAAEEGLRVLGWRDLPVDPSSLGSLARECMPTFAQLLVAGEHSPVRGVALDRLAFCLRRRAEREVNVYFPTLSSRTLGYKGMLTTRQLDDFYADLRDERLASSLAVVHSRFSTNTFPSWPLAHPYRFI
ncbi:MAG TPA: glutamate synthase subunit alpha, partial [Nocardioidaceae bacterium]|nr:glutamate synthase subunit alpha [Nocardioidaceae bacterium]